MKISSNVVLDSNIENNFPHKLLLTNTQDLKLHKAFANVMLKGKSVLNYTDLFSPNDYEKNDKIILKYFEKLQR